MQAELNEKIRNMVLSEMDLSRDMSDEEIEDASEVFALPNGQYLIVEG